MTSSSELNLGATVLDGTTTRFVLWAPTFGEVELHLVDSGRRIALNHVAPGYFAATVNDCAAGQRYWYVGDGGAELADPASRSQPDGVHGPSQVVDLDDVTWHDQAYRARPWWDHVMYELHVGTFSASGTFAGVIEQLGGLVELGVSALELMPVAQFPGTRNWGYDGVFAYCVQDSYGGAAGLQALVDACHQRGLAVVLDVVYNHLGPEGNILGEFGPYFTERYETPWGPALNFDGPKSDDVRAYFWQSARQWFRDFHVDALRLDAVHAIVDSTAIPFVTELSKRTHALSRELDRRCDLIAESAANDPQVVSPVASGGHGMHAQWNDDFHHALHVTLTNERFGYYEDYRPLSDLVLALDEGFVLQDRYSPFRQRHHGAASTGLSPDRFIVFSQNHDQIGNRKGGERLATLVAAPLTRLAAALVILGPNVPLLFMGEEWGEEAPFPYFVDHSDPALLESIRVNRQKEFGELAGGELYDAADPETFERARLDHDRRRSGEHREVWHWYRTLIALRRSTPALRHSPERRQARAWAEGSVVVLHRQHESGDVTVFFNLSSEPAALELPRGQRWRWLFGGPEPESDEDVAQLEPYGVSVFVEVRS